MAGGALTEANGNNQELYDKALAFLGIGTDAFVSSHVTKVVRNAEGVQISFNTPSGSKTIKASKLIIAIPTLPSLLEPFLNLSQQEQSVFTNFNDSYLWANIVSNSGIARKTSLTNIESTAALGIPPEPAIFLTEPTEVDDYHIVLYGSPTYISNAEVQNTIVSTLNKWKRASNRSTGSPEESARIVAFKSHSPYFFTVSTDEIRRGFYKDADSLQGKENTFYTGAAWETNDSTAIWNFTETQILPRVLASLEESSGR